MSISRATWYKARIFALTFVSYAVYCGIRQCLSLTKHTLHPSPPTPDNPGWAPFSGDDGKLLLGWLDTSFQVAYAIGLVLSGAAGDRVNLRWFLGAGMIGSGLFLALMGAAQVWSVHVLAFFLLCQIGAGLAHSTGWPGNATLMNRWFGQKHRGTLMGIWCAQSSVGYMGGKVILTAMLVAWGWQWEFMAAGAFAAVCGIGMMLWVVPFPTDRLSPEECASIMPLAVQDAAGGDVVVRSHAEYETIPFLRAVMLPGVILYSLCLFCMKLVDHAFSSWLPYYISAHFDYSDEMSNNVSIAYDMGGLIGGLLAGWISDRLHKRAAVSCTGMLLCVPALLLYVNYASVSLTMHIMLLGTVGCMIGGPYTLISSVVSGDIGRHPSLGGNPKAISTVIGLMDGVGSTGSAVQGVLIGWVSTQWGWDAVFYILMAVCGICAVLLLGTVWREFHPSPLSHAHSQLPQSALLDVELDPSFDSDSGALDVMVPYAGSLDTGCRNMTLDGDGGDSSTWNGGKEVNSQQLLHATQAGEQGRIQ